MPKTRILTEEGRRKARNEERNTMLRSCIGAYKAVSGVTYKEISTDAGIIYRTLYNHMKNPDNMTLRELRALNEMMGKYGEQYKIPLEVFG